MLLLICLSHRSGPQLTLLKAVKGVATVLTFGCVYYASDHYLAQNLLYLSVWPIGLGLLAVMQEDSFVYQNFDTQAGEVEPLGQPGKLIPNIGHGGSGLCV